MSDSVIVACVIESLRLALFYISWLHQYYWFNRILFDCSSSLALAEVQSVTNSSLLLTFLRIGKFVGAVSFLSGLTNLVDSTFNGYWLDFW